MISSHSQNHDITYLDYVYWASLLYVIFLYLELLSYFDCKYLIFIIDIFFSLLFVCKFYIMASHVLHFNKKIQNLLFLHMVSKPSRSLIFWLFWFFFLSSWNSLFLLFLSFFSIVVPYHLRLCMWFTRNRQ